MSQIESVLVLTNQYPSEQHPGEAPCIEDQVRALRQFGLAVDVEVIDRFRSPWSYLESAVRFTGRNFSRPRWQIVHAFYGHSGLAAILQRRVPVVLTYRGSDLLGGADGRIGRFVARFVDGAITMTEEMRELSGRPDARVIPFGVDLERFALLERAVARRRRGMEPSAPTVLFPYDPARRVKRMDVLESALAILREDLPDLRLEIVHSATPQEMAEYMAASDVFVLVSDYEGSPLAVREAMAMNLPVVSAAVGDVPDLIAGVDGCEVLTQRDPRVVAEAIRPYLERPRRSAGRERIATMDARWAAEQVVALYEDALRKRRGS